MELSWTEVIVRLVAASLIGALLGVDRELRNKPAGLRTHSLVAIGACLITLTGYYVSAGSPEAVSRVIQGIVAGIGFLGAGAILKEEVRHDVRGLTTAASIWVVASLGIACGAGYWRTAVVALVLSLTVLIGGNLAERKIRRIFGNRFEDDSDEGRG